MQQLRLIGVTLTVVLVLGSIVSAPALAEEGGIPKLEPAPTEKEPLNFESEGGASKLVAAGGTIECEKLTNSGSFTSQRLGSVQLNFKGCQSSKVACNTAGDASGVVLASADIHLVNINVEKANTLGAAITFTKAIVITCGGVLKLELKGAVIGELAGVESGEKSTTAKLIFAQVKGVQKFTECVRTKEFCKGKTFKLEVNISGKGFETATAEGEDKLTFTKKVQLVGALFKYVTLAEFKNNKELGLQTFEANPGVKEKITGAAITGPFGNFTATAFSVVEDKCIGVTVEPGKNCQVKIEFLQPVEGVKKPGKLNVVGIHPESFPANEYEIAVVKGEW